MTLWNIDSSSDQPWSLQRREIITLEAQLFTCLALALLACTKSAKVLGCLGNDYHIGQMGRWVCVSLRPYHRRTMRRSAGSSERSTRAYQFHGDTSLLTPTNLDIEIDPRAACRHSQSCLGFSLTGTHRPFFEDAMMSLFDAMSEFACLKETPLLGYCCCAPKKRRYYSEAFPAVCSESS